LRLIESFKEHGFLDREIAVLYPRNERTRIDDLCRVLDREGEVCWLSQEMDPGSGLKSLSRPGSGSRQ
jgi:hypothetical protein